MGPWSHAERKGQENRVSSVVAELLAGQDGVDPGQEFFSVHRLNEKPGSATHHCL
jgi:hypothetical protein